MSRCKYALQQLLRALEQSATAAMPKGQVRHQRIKTKLCTAVSAAYSKSIALDGLNPWQLECLRYNAVAGAAKVISTLHSFLLALGKTERAIPSGTSYSFSSTMQTPTKLLLPFNIRQQHNNGSYFIRVRHRNYCSAYMQFDSY